MKIMFFVSRMSAGGVEQVAALLSDGLVQLNCRPTVVAASLRGEFVSRINGMSETIDLKCEKPIKALRPLAHLIRSKKPDAILCFGIHAGIAATLSKTFYKWGAPIFIRNENNLASEWSGASPLNRRIGPPLSRWAAKRSHIIAVSHSLAAATAEYLNLPADSVTTILNPVLKTSSKPNPSPNQLHPWLEGANTPVFVAAGRLAPQKGFDLLIEAFSRVRQQTQARLIIFGEGESRSNLQKQIDSLQLGDSITLAGFTENPVEQMRAAHAFVLSSRHEGFGLVLVEALWAGTRVISTDCDFGPAELLENGRYGNLVPTNNAEALAAVMLKSMHDPSTWARPTEDWFDKFTAFEAASHHLNLIKSYCN